jgi:predicted dithiol-disulfide oxidoreductase (DUF899 family)
MHRSAIVSRDEWIAARKQFLAKEKEPTRRRDQLSAERREQPWVKVDKAYVFDGPNGKETLADLFGERSQLIVYQFMFGPEWNEGCPSCSYLVDHIDGAIPHLAARDVSLVLVSRAPLAKIEAFKKRMGWRFKWVSSFGGDLWIRPSRIGRPRRRRSPRIAAGRRRHIREQHLLQGRERSWGALARPTATVTHPGGPPRSGPP